MEAGKLKARYVIHAATMGMDFQTDAGKIRRATRNAMKRAVELGVRSVAFPALGTGVGGFPVREAVRLMYDEVKAFADHDIHVAFVLYSQKDYEEALKTLQEIGAV